MNTAPVLLQHPWGEAHLERHPQHRHPNLQAWDGADRYALEYMAEQGALSGSVLVINDNWGALACALAQSGCTVFSLGDSFISYESLRQNMVANGVDVAWQWATETTPSGAGRVLMRLPKELSLLEYQLAELSQAGYGGAELLLAGMDKHLPRSLLPLLADYLWQPQALLGKYKARLFRGVIRSDNNIPAIWQPVKGLPGVPLVNGPGVFGRQHLDIGARFLIDNLPAELQGRVCDLGCGNGALGLAVLQRHPQAAVTFCDESAWAIATARRNLATLFPEAMAAFHLGNGLEGHEQHYDHILLNPPFHRGFELETLTASKLFAESASHLNPGSQLLIVANRHLEYQGLLRRLFRRVERLADSNKFVVWRCPLE